MENAIRTGKELVVRRQLADVANFDREVRVVLAVGKIFQPAPKKVVNDVDTKALVEQQIDHVASDETSAARHHCELARAHFKPSAFTVFTLTNDSSLSVSVENFPSLKARKRSRTASSMFRFGCQPSFSEILREVMR